jgi:hypothetical protein
LRKAIASLPGRKTAVQASRLKAGGAVMRHVDPPDYDRGRVLAPVHLVVTTNPSVRFFINGQALRMRVGEVWAINPMLPHEVYNVGKSDRAHLLIHLVWDAAVADFFARARKYPVVPGASDEAAKKFARRYLARAKFGSLTAAQTIEKPEIASRRRAAVVAQLLKVGAA